MKKKGNCSEISLYLYSHILIHKFCTSSIERLNFFFLIAAVIAANYCFCFDLLKIYVYGDLYYGDLYSKYLLPYLSSPTGIRRSKEFDAQKNLAGNI